MAMEDSSMADEEIERLEGRLGFTLTPWQRELAERLVDARRDGARVDVHLSRMQEKAIARRILHEIATMPDLAARLDDDRTDR